MIPHFVSLGPFTLNLYTALVALAALTPPAWAWLRTRDGRIFPAALIVALSTCVFGRAGYVALHWDYFHERQAEIASLAGLSEHAAVIGGLVAVWGLRRASRAPDTLYRVLAAQVILVGISASIGCIPNGCAYGREVFWQTDGEHSLAWLLRADWPDAYSIHNPRWPTQTFMALWLAIVGTLLGAAWIKATRQRTFIRFHHLLILLALIAIGDLVIQFLRADPAPAFAGLRIYQWLDLAMILLGVAILLSKICVGTRAAVDRTA